jgi:hypothetical protein
VNVTTTDVRPERKARPSGEGGDRRIARILFVLLIAIFLVGFAKNFYLRAWLGTRPLILTAWVHGIVMTAWLGLFATQIVLVARGRTDLHRKLGEVGAWLALAVVLIGAVTIWVRERLLYADAAPFTVATVFTAFDGLSLFLFGALVAIAWHYRRRAALHRRLMTMALVALLPPALGRSVAYVRHDHVEILVLAAMTITVVVFVTVDALRSGRIQRASALPGLFIVLVDGATYLAQVSI